jgi:hypothetical protein
MKAAEFQHKDIIKTTKGKSIGIFTTQMEGNPRKEIMPRGK